MRFTDRREAGRMLAKALAPYRRDRPVILGISPGGVVVAEEVALALGAPLDVWIVGRIGVPGHPGVAIGAVAEGPALVLERRLLRALDVPPARVLAAARAQVAELRHRAEHTRGEHPVLDLRGRAVVLVDDGVDASSELRAAARGVRKRGARRVIAAAPVIAPATVDQLRHDVDEVVAVHLPPEVQATAHWYLDYRPVSDVEVLRRIAAARLAAVSHLAAGQSASATARR